MEDNSTAAWLKVGDNGTAFCNAIGPEVVFKACTHSLIAFNVAFMIDPDNKRHREEICEANHLNGDMIFTMHWVKSIARHSSGQKTAHLTLSFADADTANRAIANRLTISGASSATAGITLNLSVY